MTNPTASPVPAARSLVCERCGTGFSCALSGDCWCTAEPVQLPLPAAGSGADCVCPDCLRKAAAHAAATWQVDAVLLDMDGTLLDTERVYLASLNTALAQLGFGDGTALGHAMIGIPGPECEVMLRDHFGADFPLAALNDAYVISRDEMLHENMPLKPGAVELLDALRAAACPIALVTSSSRPTAEAHLAAGGIRAHFETLLTRDDVARGKPHPDLYLLAAQRLGVRPAACVAIEDSGPGIASAYSAGAIPLLVPDIVTPGAETLAKCAAVVPDLHAALTLLQQRAGIAR
jgi:HAD superfamily hydrolase (TIGR01509 family)